MSTRMRVSSPILPKERSDATPRFGVQAPSEYAVDLDLLCDASVLSLRDGPQRPRPAASLPRTGRMAGGVHAAGPVSPLAIADRASRRRCLPLFASAPHQRQKYTEKTPRRFFFPWPSLHRGCHVTRFSLDKITSTSHHQSARRQDKALLRSNLSGRVVSRG